MFDSNRYALLRWGLVFYALLFAATCFVGRALIVWKRTGVFPVTYRTGDSAHDWVGRAFGLLTILTGIVVGFHALMPGSIFQFYSGGIYWFQRVSDVAIITGLCLLAFGFVMTASAQAQMGESWRIGVDENTKTTLVARGWYRFSRNPIYLGVLITALGFFLVLPTALTLLILTCAYFLIQVQVRLEEEHMRKLHGRAFEDYCLRVRRWI